MAAKSAKKGSEILIYKGKPMFRIGNKVYYGNPEDKFIIIMTENDYEDIGGLKVANSVNVALSTNDTKGKGKEKIIKQSDREGIYDALDFGEYWLQDALGEI